MQLPFRPFRWQNRPPGIPVINRAQLLAAMPPTLTRWMVYGNPGIDTTDVVSGVTWPWSGPVSYSQTPNGPTTFFINSVSQTIDNGGRAASFSDVSYRWIFQLTSVGAALQALLVGGASWYINTSGNFLDNGTSTTITLGLVAGVDYDLVITGKNGGNAFIYLNGVNKGNWAWGSPSTSGTLWSDSFNQSVKGHKIGFQIFKTILTPTQVAALYNNERYPGFYFAEDDIFSEIFSPAAGPVTGTTPWPLFQRMVA